MWLKYRTSWAWGQGKWGYYFLNPEGGRVTKKELLSIVEDLAEQNNPGSDKYRGIQYQKVRRPPLEYLKNLIEQKKAGIKYAKEELKKLEAQIP